MSKASYARGFCKAAAAAGVDPGQLAKFAAQTTDAGIGSRLANSSKPDYANAREVPYNPNSYAGRLLARHPGYNKGVALPHIFIDPLQGHIPVSLTDLERARRYQAEVNAGRVFPEGSAPYKRILNNLINAGKENHKSYLETGDTKERAEPDSQGIEKVKLTPEQKNLLLQMQNTMALSGAPRTGNIA